MTDSEIEALSTDLESDRVERKESVSSPARIREAICAFANDLPGHDQPGVIIVGLKDDGSCSHLPITDSLLRQLSDMKTDGNITPFPSLTVQKRMLRGCEVAVVIVQCSEAPPVRYRGRVCVRVGPRRDYATPEEERRLTERRRASDLPFDARPVRSAELTELDEEFFLKSYLPQLLPEDILAENRRTVREQLASVRFLSPGPDGRPTAAGLLTVGRDPTRFLPGAYVQFVRFAGMQLTDPIKDSEEISGPMAEMMLRLDDKMRANIAVSSEITSGPIETRRPDFPITALQQFVNNAVLHRTYEGTNSPVRINWFDDRVEIHSPGGPYGHVSVRNFGISGVTDYRNPHLAEAMKTLGFVQKFGVGIPIARDALLKNGSPSPELLVEPSHVLVVVRRRP